MDEALRILSQAGVFYLSTVEDTPEGPAPRTRPHGAVFLHEGRPCFTTSKTKPTFAQLTANPNVEVCAMAGQTGWLRLHGRARVITSETTRSAAIEANPMVQQTYAVLGGEFEVFCLDDAVADYYNTFGADGNIVKKRLN